MATRTLGLWATALALAVAAAALLIAQADGSGPDPKKAADELVARMHPKRVEARGCTLTRSKVVTRGRQRWLAVNTTCFPNDRTSAHVRIFRWSGRAWRRDGTVTGPIGPSPELTAVSLTGARAPDFALVVCGAGDTVCVSVVSKAGGSWHAIPWEFGYGTTLEAYGSVEGRRAQLVVNACHCAGGPTTTTYMRYARGRFVPAQPPGGDPRCGPTALAEVVQPWQVRLIRFTYARCAAGWALAVGDGAGSSEPVVGLFVREPLKRRWLLLTLDAGNALPGWPALYALPLSLLERLAAGAGPTLAPHLAAAKLIAGLVQTHGDGFYWPSQNGIVEAGGKRWLIAIVPAGPDPHDGSTPPAGAEIYRWDGTAWVVDGRIARVPEHLNAAYYGGWFVSRPTSDPSAVAFDLAGDGCCRTKGHSVLTNAGGEWHVAEQ
jgi:hypothetical protein